MNVKWLIEEGYFWDKNLDTLTPALEKLGIPYIFVDCLKLKEIAASRRSLVDCLSPKNTPYVYEDSDCVIAYGSIEFIDALRKAPFIPCCWNNYENLKCSTYYSYYGKYLLNEHYAFLPWGEIKGRKRDYVFNTFQSVDSILSDTENEIFIRPDSGKKEFCGCIAKYSTMMHDVSKMSYGTLEDHWLCVVSDVKKITEEYRFVIADGKVIGGCTYKVDGEHDERVGYPESAFMLAERIAVDKWQPCKVYSIDICASPDFKGHVEYYLLEINGFNTAGMYLCDWNKMVPVLNGIALNEWKEQWGEPEITEAK